MRVMMSAALMLMSGCGLLGNRTVTPVGAGQPMWPHEAEYEILGVGGGDVCASQEEIKQLKGLTTKDPNAVGPAFMFERAKVAAIQSVEGADALMFVRAWVEWKEGQQCVHVSGRGIKLTKLRAVAGQGAQPEHRGNKLLTLPE